MISIFLLNSKQLGTNLEDPQLAVSNCNKTCPEDCSNDEFSVNLTKSSSNRIGNNNISLATFGCSTFPTFDETIETCMEHFDYKQHINSYLLPDDCGKQTTGWKNSVT